MLKYPKYRLLTLPLLVTLAASLLAVSCDSGGSNRSYHNNGYGQSGIYSNYGAGAILQTAPQSSAGSAFYNGTQFYGAGHFPTNACTPCRGGSYLHPSHQNFNSGYFDPYTNNRWQPPSHAQTQAAGIGTFSGSRYQITQPFYNVNGCPVYMPSHAACSGGVILSEEHYRSSQYLQGAGVAFYRGDVQAAQRYLAEVEGNHPEGDEVEEELIQSEEDLLELFGAQPGYGATGSAIAEKNHPTKQHLRPDWRFLNRDLQEISEGLAASIEQMGFNLIHTPLHSIRRSISRIEDRMYLDSFAAYGWDSPQAYFGSAYGNLGPVCCP